MYTKDVVCLVPSMKGSAIAIPRGEKRAELAAFGLVGKVSINSSWKVADVKREITSVFASAFSLKKGEILDFDYLRLANSRKLVISPSLCFSHM